MFETIIGVILLVAAIFLIVSVLLQSSKSHKLPGTIAGGAETFFGKTKGGKIDRMLETLTTIVAIVFCVLVVVLYVGQETTVLDNSALVPGDSSVETQDISAMIPTDTSAADTAADTDADTAADTAADTEADIAEDTAVDTAADTSAEEPVADTAVDTEVVVDEK